MAEEEDNNLLSKQDDDPAEFLMTNAEYHDCYLKVGDPDTDIVETIGVSKAHLIAHSSIFRDMLADSKLADPSSSNTHIKDVSPATFKLMLRYVYRGKLPEMTPEEAADLALSADKYNIQRLVEKAVKRLKPTTAEDFFPAFMCFANIKFRQLKHKIRLQICLSTIINQQTDKVVSNPKFLQLDRECLLFIVRQSMMNINELELWDNLVRWAENQLKKYPGKTLRYCLNGILEHVRLLSLSLDEIDEHVLPKKVLTLDEIYDLTQALSKKQTLQSHRLCKLREERVNYDLESVNKQILDKKIPSFNKYSVFCSKLGINYELEQLESERYSTITIITIGYIEINTLTLGNFRSNTANRPLVKPFSFTCSITVYKLSKGQLINTETVSLKGTAVSIENIVLHDVKKSNGQPLILEANETYSFQIEMSPPFPVYKMYDIDFTGGRTDKTTSWITHSHFNIKFENPFHVLKIGYSF